MQKLLLWVIPTFSRSSLLIISVNFVALCYIDTALGQLFRPSIDQTWWTTISPFLIVFGIPTLYSLFISVYGKSVPHDGQNILVILSSLIYFFIGNIASWNNFVDNAVHSNTIYERLKDLLLLIYAVKSYALLIIFILIKKNLKINFFRP
jgi:hypothetical protein